MPLPATASSIAERHSLGRAVAAPGATDGPHDHSSPGRSVLPVAGASSHRGGLSFGHPSRPSTAQRCSPLVLVALLILAPPAARGVRTAAAVPVAPAQSTAELQVVGQLGGDVVAVARAGDRPVIGVGPRVAVVDVDDPAVPVMVGLSDPLPGTVVDLALQGRFAYVIAGGLSVVDLTDPARPRQVGYLAVGMWDTLNGWTGPTRISAGDGMVALAGGVDDYKRVTLVDVRDPARPALAARLEQIELATDVVLSGRMAFVAVDGYIAGATIPDVAVFDLTDPTSPRQIGGYGGGPGAYRLALSGGRLIVVGAECPITVLDITDPSEPTRIACGHPFGEDWNPGIGVDLSVDGDTAFLVDAYGGVWVVDVAGTAPRAIGYASVAPSAFGVTAADGVALVATGPHGLRVVEAHDPANPRQLGALEIVDPAGFLPGALAVAERFAYVAQTGGRGIAIVDIGEPSTPRLTGTISCPSERLARQIAVLGDHLLVASDGASPRSTLSVMDVSDPAAPLLLATTGLETATRAVAIDGHHAFLAVSNGLTVVDLTDPAQPVRVADLYLGTGAKDVAVHHGYAYLAGSDLQVINVRDPSAPVAVGSTTIAAEGGATRVAVHGDRVYVADLLARGVWAFDVTDPTVPTARWHIPATHASSATITALLATADRLHVATDRSGLWVFDVGGDKPRVIATVPGRERTVALGFAAAVTCVVDSYDVSDRDARPGWRLRLFDLSDGADVRPQGVLHPGGSFQDAVVAGDLVYLAGASTGIHVIDIAIPTAPREIQVVPVLDGVRRLAKAGDYLYAVGVRFRDDRLGLHGGADTFVCTLDLADPRRPRVVNEVQRPGAVDMVSMPGHLVIADGAGLTIMAIGSDPTRPDVVGQIGSSRAGLGYDRVAVAGQRAYAVRPAGRSGPEPPMVRVIDLADGMRPELLGEVPVGDRRTNVGGIVAVGDLVYLATGSDRGGLVIIDAGEPRSPAILGSWESAATLPEGPFEPHALAVRGRDAFVASVAGLHLFDVVVAGYPAEVTWLPLPGSVFRWLASPSQGVAFGPSGHLYLPRGGAGLYVVSASLPVRPTPTAGPSPTRTPSPTAYPTFTPSASPTPSATRARSPSATPTQRLGGTPTASATGVTGTPGSGATPVASRSPGTGEPGPTEATPTRGAGTAMPSGGRVWVPFGIVGR